MPPGIRPGMRRGMGPEIPHRPRYPDHHAPPPEHRRRRRHPMDREMSPMGRRGFLGDDMEPPHHRRRHRRHREHPDELRPERRGGLSGGMFGGFRPFGPRHREHRDSRGPPMRGFMSSIFGGPPRHGGGFFDRSGGGPRFGFGSFGGPPQRGPGRPPGRRGWF